MASKWEGEVEVVKATENALLIRPDEDEEKEGWVPISLIDAESRSELRTQLHA